MRERRAHIRYDFRNEITYLQDSHRTGEDIKGITIDISDGGIGLYSFSRLRPGQTITITGGIEQTYRNCTVAWCKELGDDVFRAGLFFTRDSTAHS